MNNTVMQRAVDEGEMLLMEKFEAIPWYQPTLAGTEDLLEQKDLICPNPTQVRFLRTGSPIRGGGFTISLVNRVLGKTEPERAIFLFPTPDPDVNRWALLHELTHASIEVEREDAGHGDLFYEALLENTVRYWDRGLDKPAMIEAIQATKRGMLFARNLIDIEDETLFLLEAITFTRMNTDHIRLLQSLRMGIE